MTISRDERGFRPELQIDAILDLHANIAGDILEIEPHTWAIHGAIPVDGDVILGQFESPDTARAVLDQLPATEDRAGGEH